MKFDFKHKKKEGVQLYLTNSDYAFKSGAVKIAISSVGQRILKIPNNWQKENELIGGFKNSELANKKILEFSKTISKSEYALEGVWINDHINSGRYNEDYFQNDSESVVKDTFNLYGKSIKEVTITDWDYKNIDLSKLTELNFLWLTPGEKSKIEFDMDLLHNCKNLERLRIEDHKIHLTYSSKRDKKGISKAINLCDLKIKNFDSITSFPKLKSLDISYDLFTQLNKLSNIEEFKPLEELTLRMGRNKGKIDFAPLLKYTNLKSISFKDTDQTNFSDLSKIPQLEHASVNDTSITLKKSKATK